MSRVLLLALAAVSVWSWPAVVYPQAIPPGPIRLVSPFAPGGLTDLLARLLSNDLGAAFGRNVIVDNRPGAGGNIGAELVAKATADGRTLLLSSPSPLTINEFLYVEMPFNSQIAFAPISKLADMSQLMVVYPKKVISLAELLSIGAKKPEYYRFGSAGSGSIAHLALEMFGQVTKIRTIHVPYKGAGPAAQDLLGGQIDGIFTNPPTVIAHVQAGRLRALGVAGGKRLAALPEVPTFSEQGVKNFEASSWFGLLAPAGTPPKTVQELNRAVVKILQVQETQKRFSEMGAELSSSTPQEFDAFIRAERKKWGAIIRTAGIKVN
ncbi:MAG: tripartite tricarboxylate transporter substrate binding protein [Burkholderiales bacterium]|nr:tripartite tricarboxylate transporter substrate binding protein [Burkholderiales bacterium]